MKIVMKFGGTSIADTEKIKNVATIINNQHKTADVAVVVSAMGKTTNALTALAHQITDKPNLRELDALLSTGENVSAALVAMALKALGCPAISYNAFQAEIHTDNNYGDAKIKYIGTPHISTPFDLDISNGVVPVIAGFQGITDSLDITTLGREGSDTSAVAIAAAIHADYCDIYTDVNGVYDQDPNVFENAKKLDFVRYDDMLKMAKNGAKVLHPRSVMTAKQYNIPIRVRGTFAPYDLGTLVAASKQK